MDADDAESEIPDGGMGVKTPMREEWIDRLKGILITLVVLGHAVGSAAITADESVRPFFSGVYRVIYLFHMPAFFLLSGMLWKRPTGSFGAFVLRKMKRLLVPFWVFGCFSMIIYWLFAGQVAIQDASGYWLGTMRERHWWAPLFALVTGSSYPGTDGFKCNSVLWFLPCLFVMHCLYWWVERLRIAGWIRLVGGTVAIMGWLELSKVGIPWYPLQLNEVLRYGFFFVVGDVAGAFWKKIRWNWMLTVCVVVGYLYGARQVPYGYWTFTHLNWWGVAVLTALAGSVAALLLAKSVKGRWFVDLGECSMGIMLLHKIPLLAIQTRIPMVVEGMRSVSQWVAATTCVGMTFVVIMFSYAGTKMILHWCPWALGVGTQTVSKRCLWRVFRGTRMLRDRRSRIEASRSEITTYHAD